MVGLIALPLIAYSAMQQQGWRAGWLAVGAAVLLVGFVPTWLLHGAAAGGRGAGARRAVAGIPATGAARRGAHCGAGVHARPGPAHAGLLAASLYTAAVFPVQAGVSLHQAPHLIERGLSPTTAATVVSTFSLASAIAGLLFGLFARRIGVRMSLALAGASLGVSAVLMLGIATPGRPMSPPAASASASAACSPFCRWPGPITSAAPASAPSAAPR